MQNNIGCSSKAKLSKLMLLAGFLSMLFYSASYPYVYAETIKIVPASYISIENILQCLSTILFCWIWNKFSDRLFKYYGWITLAEIIADIVLFTDVLIRHDLKFYFLLNVLIYAIITRNMACGGTKMRAKVHPDEKLREQYDNNINIVCSVATVLGASVALFYQIPLKGLFILAFTGNIIDNVIYLIIFKELNHEYK